MRKYYEYIKNSFKDQFAYRVGFFTGITQRLLAIFVQLYLWEALIGQSGSTTSTAGTITLEEMTTYVLISNLIGILLSHETSMEISERVRNGLISIDLIKPMNFMGYMFTRMVGVSIFMLFSQILPVIVLIAVFFDIEIATPMYMFFFLVSLFGAYLITFFIKFILGLLSFWYMQIWQVDDVLDGLLTLFSGRWVPLWFFPEIFNTISAFLPFRLMYYMPLSIYLGKVDYSGCWYVILQEFVWVLVLYGAARLMWRMAVKKLVIQGG